MPDLAVLRDEVGPQGVVLGVDLTPAMLTAAAREGRADLAHLLIADACRLPLPVGSLDGVFSAGLVDHVWAAPGPRRPAGRAGPAPRAAHDGLGPALLRGRGTRLPGPGVRTG